MRSVSRRDLLRLGVAAPAILAPNYALAAPAGDGDVHQHLLELAAAQEEKRRARFAAVKTKSDVFELRSALKESFLRLLDNLPENAWRPAGPADGDDRSRGLFDRETRLRKLSWILRAGLALQAQEAGIASPWRSQSLRPFRRRKGCQSVPDPAYQPGQTRLRRLDL